MKALSVLLMLLVVANVSLCQSVQGDSAIDMTNHEILKQAEIDLHFVGDKMENSAVAFYVGTAATIAGSVLSFVGAQKGNQTMLYVGSGVALGGAVIGFSAFISIHRSGLKLKRIKLTK